jgi:hypothetical protein
VKTYCETLKIGLALRKMRKYLGKSRIFPKHYNQCKNMFEKLYIKNEIKPVQMQHASVVVLYYVFLS